MAISTSSALALHVSLAFTITSTPTAGTRHALPILNSIGNRRIVGLARCSLGGISKKGQGAFDPDLRPVLELATDSELYELERILFGPSYFSPLLKSITGRRVDIDYAIIEEDLAEREAFIEALESRFLFLAADARSTIRGWRPSYRNVLLAVRKKLNIPCSRKLSTEDLEAEIFLHLVQDYSSEESDTFLCLWESSTVTNDQGSLELGPRQWKGPALAARKLGLAELQSMILKGGQLAAVNLESRAALLAAKQGFAGAASRYLGFRSMMSLLGPLMWGTFLADVVIQMLGTDYARILRAIYAFAEIRVTRTYRPPSDNY
ncbi:uncharacterized protein LOC110643077 isoform X4 [Hevea brasiliensis]|uniref:uncharacterized protein LOC110643077 isoform X4 n=1 Tax=Hevea brasiliensis TaxID=3981 RepID=UPI0025F37E5D|nr:uncharacterized protein LOC110643077 isoform X4 [Hevea brasiliensis]